MSSVRDAQELRRGATRRRGRKCACCVPVYEVVHHGYEDEEQECSTEYKKEHRLTNVRNQFSTDADQMQSLKRLQLKDCT